MKEPIRNRLGGLIPAMMLALSGLLAPATVVAADDDWQFDATLYLWGAGIDGTTRTGGDIDISFGDLWDNLDMAFMGALEARKGKWGLLGDFVYLYVSADDSATEQVPVIGPITIPVKVNADVSMKNRIASFAGTYRVVDSGRATLSLCWAASVTLSSTST